MDVFVVVLSFTVILLVSLFGFVWSQSSEGGSGSPLVVEETQEENEEEDQVFFILFFILFFSFFFLFFFLSFLSFILYLVVHILFLM